MTTPQELRSFFDAVDVDRSGVISVTELQDALGKSGYIFSLTTVRQFLNISGGSADGITFDNFEKLHVFLTSANESFTKVARGASTLNKQQVRIVLQENGYTWLEDPAFEALCKAFDPDNDGKYGVPELAAMLSFLKACVGVFRGFDSGGTGVISINLNQFLYAASNTR